MERFDQKTALLFELSRAIDQCTDLDRILDCALDVVIDGLGMENAGIDVRDSDADRFTLRASRGLSEAQLQLIERFKEKPGGNFSQQVVESGKEVFVPNLAANELFQDTLWGGSFVNVPLKSKSDIVGTMGLVTQIGKQLTEYELEVLKAVGSVVGIAIDNILLVEQLRRVQCQRNTLNKLFTQISASLNLSQVLETVAVAVRDICGTGVGVVGLIDDERHDIVIEETAGTKVEWMNRLRFPVEQTAIGTALLSGHPFILRGQQFNDLITPGIPFCEASCFTTFVAVPLTHNGSLIGMLGAGRRSVEEFSDETMYQLTTLAQHAATSINNAQLYQHARYIAMLDERIRLSRELHDNLAQSLGCLILKVNTTDELLTCDKIDQAQSSLLEVKQISKAAYTDVREAIFSLRTVPLLESGFLSTLKEYLSEYELHYGVATKLILDSEDVIHMSPESCIQVLRIIQEALANSRKHGLALNVVIRFQHVGSAVIVTVTDDGCGFNPEEIAGIGSHHSGLQIMHERAESVGGKLTIDSRPGFGTCVSIALGAKQEE